MPTRTVAQFPGTGTPHIAARKTGGFLYVDVADALPLLSLAGYAGVDLPKELLENLRPIRSVIAWSQAYGTTSAQTLFVHIQ